MDLKNKVTKMVTVTMLMLSFMSPTVLQSITVFANSGDIYSYSPTEDCDVDGDSKDKSKDKDKSSKSATAGEGDWLTPGTETNKVAQEIFDLLTKEYGTSGAFASGVIANSHGESSFVPDRGESAFDKPYQIRRFGMNNKKPVDGMGPSTATQNASYGYTFFGGGLFQFTPYQKFADSEYWGKINKSEGWAVENQVAFLWYSEFANKAVLGYFHKVGDNKFSTVEELISTDDPAAAAQYFQMAYERPESYHPERSDWAKQANSVFNKDNIKADKSKWKFNGNSAGNSKGVKVSSKDDKEKEEVCGTEDGDKKSTGGAWGKDNTGSHSLNPSGWGLGWKPEDLPDELKKYALDPESVGLKYGAEYGKDPWISTYPQVPGQCVELTTSLTSALWSKNGQKPPRVGGNGWENARWYANNLGGKTTKTPQAGAVWSTIEAHNHTGIVSHVFENGDVLVIEQNVLNLSGSKIGKPCTWNYRLIAKKDVPNEFNEFWYPGDAGYEVNKDAKTLA